VVYGFEAESALFNYCDRYHVGFDVARGPGSAAKIGNKSRQMNTTPHSGMKQLVVAKSDQRIYEPEGREVSQ
jgi:hypothetical protein